MNTILEHIALWTTAQTPKASGRGNRADNQQLLGIQKLRELILELAVRGKLVPQDPKDEPASVLLKKIEAEKKRLIKEGKIKKQEVLPEVSEDEKPFDLPNGWKWTRLPVISTYCPGKTPSTKNPNFWADGKLGIPWVSISDMIDKGFVSETRKSITQEAINKVFKSPPSLSGSIIMSFKLTVGKISILRVDSYHNEAIISIYPFTGANRDYLFKILPKRALEGNTKNAIMGDTLNAKSLSNLLIPLPPLTEQHRIVAKVDELMALCDQLEQQQTENNQLHQTLVETLLANLTQAGSPAERQEAWQRIANHFDTLFTTEYSIEQLKQTILQLAIMGKLVPQNPADEPASELLKKIAKEKARLVKEGKIKKQAPLPEITDDEKPFELPKGWEFVRFDDIVDITSGVTKGRKLMGRKTRSVPYLSVANVQRGSLDLSYVKDIDILEEELDKFRVEDGDLLITEGGDWDKVGRTAIWKGELPLTIHQNHIFKARRFLTEQDEIWLERYLNSNVAREYFAKSSKQTTNLASINKTQLRGCIIAIPPLAEQHRIVAKVDELFALCDGLKERLAQAQNTQNLLAGVVAHALASKPSGKVVYATNEQINVAAEPK